MNKLSVYIIAYNEAAKIRATLESVQWADEIIVADSHSTDGTTEIAQSLGAKIVHIPFHGYGDLRNQAIKHCSHPWIFSIDCDERMTSEAKEEILKTINDPNAVSAYFMPRKNLVMGRWIKYSWPYPNYRQPQLFKNGKMRYTEDKVHESFVMLDNSTPGHLTQAIWQYPFKDISQILYKMDRYSTLNAEKSFQKNKKTSIFKIFTRAFWSFFKYYFLKRGFMDGWPGFVIAFSNFEGTFYHYAKLKELWRIQQAEVKTLSDKKDS